MNNAPSPFELREEKTKPPLELSEKEREIILALRRVYFWQFNRQNTIVLKWSGASLVILDTRQI